MSKNQSSAQSAVEGELGLDDLEKIAGGATDPTGTPTSDPSVVFTDVPIPVLVPTCNMQTSHMGAKGFIAEGQTMVPVNLTLAFP